MARSCFSVHCIRQLSLHAYRIRHLITAGAIFITKYIDQLHPSRPVPLADRLFRTLVPHLYEQDSQEQHPGKQEKPEHDRYYR